MPTGASFQISGWGDRLISALETEDLSRKESPKEYNQGETLDPRTRLRLESTEPLIINGLGLGKLLLVLLGAELSEERHTDNASAKNGTQGQKPRSFPQMKNMKPLIHNFYDPRRVVQRVKTSA